jgi:pimeloyl-ACP methyl ester carboxylesterase
MVRVGSALVSWLLGQMESLPIELLRVDRLGGAPMRILDAVYGEREAEEVRALLNRPSGGGYRPNTVLLPGLMGSLLASIRGIGAMIWVNPAVIMDGHINLLDLSDDGQHDRSPDVEIVPVGIEKLSYLKLILALSRASRLYEFPYDWRRHLEYNAGLLRESIRNWAGANPGRRFVLVGHSLGGMLARTYLALYPEEAERHIERVVLIGSPLYGAAMTVLVFTGESPSGQLVARLNPGNDVVGFARNLPVSYQLLPPPADLFRSDRPYPLNWDPYDAAAWGLEGIRQDYLDDARRLHERLAAADTQVEIVQIAGCHRCTVTDVWLTERDAAGRPSFTRATQECGADSGDGVVPVYSSRVEGMPVYCIEEAHQMMPGNTRVIDAVLSLIDGSKPDLPGELPEPTGLRSRLNAVPLVQQATELRQKIERGEFRREDLTRIFFAH